MDARRLLRQLVEANGTTLYLHVGSPPIARVAGKLVRLGNEKFTPVSIKQAVYEILKPRQRGAFEIQLKLDFAYSVPGLSRFRAALSLHRGTIAAQFTRLASELPTLDHLEAPPVLTVLCEEARGLVVVSGPAGSGRSTTLAALVNEINHKRACTLSTIEEPIEYLHPHREAIVAQQEVGTDTPSFQQAIAQMGLTLPDVVMLGRVPDAQVLTEAIILAERGCLVLLPIRARGVEATLHELHEFFPIEQRAQMREQVAMTLTAIVSQVLVPRADGTGVRAAFEVLIANRAVRDCIRTDHLTELDDLMAAGAELGMCTLEQSLQSLAARGLITEAVRPGPHSLVD